MKIGPIQKYMNRDLETKEYRFNEAKHLHQLLVDGEWKNLTGCTTVLGILAKPALIQWSANMAVAFLETVYKTDGKISDVLFKEAKTAHRRKKEEAGAKGTDIHSEAEKVVAMAIQNDGVIQLDIKSEIPQIQHFIDWAVKNKVKFLEVEKCMYSKKLFVGGICDILCEIDNQLWMADIKTGSGIYYDAFWQMGGYEIMMNEMGYPDIVGHIVLNLKKDGTFDEKRSVSTEDAKKGFMSCLEIYRLQEKFTNQII